MLTRLLNNVPNLTKPRLFLALGGLALAALALAPGEAPAGWKLDNFHPAARHRFAALFRRIEQHTGGKVVVTSTHRSSTFRSYHYFGLGVDFNVVIKGVWYKSTTRKARWEATGVPKLIRDAGMRWGGDFVSTPYDPIHADLGRDYNIAALQARARRMAGTASTSSFDGRRVALA